ncbi:nuclear condensing complex subunit [Mrakia frigida]|uniref:condensin subunit YCG1 n=1 Tax=Mrakia frigida TaxID=29902 RepID=UPI003FCC1F23
MAPPSKRSPPSPPDLPTLLAPLPQIFAQTQTSTANHSKNVALLRKIQEQAALVTTPRKKGPPKETGELAFTEAFVACLERCLPVKKGVAVADRVLKFVAAFVQALTKAHTEAQAGHDEDDEDDDTTASRFNTEIFNFVSQGFEAKDKHVRYRCCQLAALLLPRMPALDEDVYASVRLSLLERARDKEVPVRVQAILALSSFHGQDAEDEDEIEVLGELMDITATDPSADVRQTALFSLPFTPRTLPVILLRTRDVDPSVRRTVYLQALSLAQIQDPRRLTIRQREEVVRNGLGDRDPKVRQAAGTMLTSWFLSRFDVVTSQEAETALVSVFSSQTERFEDLEFDDQYFIDLTPEKALLARVFVQRCRQLKDEERLEESLPVVTALAFHIQAQYNSLLALLEELDEPDLSEDDRVDGEQNVIEKEFIIKEMMKLAVELDYSDETGRRKMRGLAREMIASFDLPPTIIPHNLDVLRKISETERDLIRVIVEVVHEIRDAGVDPDETADDEDTRVAPDFEEEQEEGLEFGAAPPIAAEKPLHRALARMSLAKGEAVEGEAAEVQRKAIVDNRALMVLKALLERVNGSLQENSVLDGLVPDLIVPAVRSKVPELREQAIVCLGLISLIDKKTATSTFGLFLSQAQKTDGRLKVQVLQIIFDLLMIYDWRDLVPLPNPANLIDLLVFHLEQADEDLALAVVVEGSAKLMLAGMVTDPVLLTQLVLQFIFPETADIAPLRQCLGYFLPVYCFSSPVNQRRMKDIFLPTLQQLLSQEDEDGITPGQFSLLFLDWTDPQRAVHPEGRAGDEQIQVDMAVDVLKALFSEEWDDHRKVFAQLLPKLYFPEDSEASKVKEVMLLAKALRIHKPLADTVSRNALSKLETSLAKRFSKDVASWASENKDKSREVKKSVKEYLEAM